MKKAALLLLFVSIPFFAFCDWEQGVRHIFEDLNKIIFAIVLFSLGLLAARVWTNKRVFSVFIYIITGLIVLPYALLCIELMNYPIGGPEEMAFQIFFIASAVLVATIFMDIRKRKKARVKGGNS